MAEIKNNTVTSKQKQKQKSKLQEKTDQKHRETINQLAVHAPKLQKKKKKKKKELQNKGSIN